MHRLRALGYVVLGSDASHAPSSYTSGFQIQDPSVFSRAALLASNPSDICKLGLICSVSLSRKLPRHFGSLAAHAFSFRVSDSASSFAFPSTLYDPEGLFVATRDSSRTSPFTEADSCKRTKGGGTFQYNHCLSLPKSITNSSFLQNGSSSEVDQAGLRHLSNPESTTQKSYTGDQGSDERIDPSSVAREEDIESRLPELKEMLCLLRSRLESEQDCRSKVGNVFLVGTGPGDPQLLTLKALHLMQTADLVLYDRLVSTDILDMVHASACLLYVGKTSGYHSRTQEEIHQLLLSFAEAGATVLRLKGGDPLVFGRGGEEMDFLQAQGIQVKVVPGITAASGIAAELGVPLTHRGVANSVRFLTGHSRKGEADPLYIGEQAAEIDSTLVVYMGLQTLPRLAAKLIANGLAPDTPSVAVERGTTSQQRSVFAYLKDLPGEVTSKQLVSPTLIIIGKVVLLSPFWPSTLSLRNEDISSVNCQTTKVCSAFGHQTCDGILRDCNLNCDILTT